MQTIKECIICMEEITDSNSKLCETCIKSILETKKESDEISKEILSGDK